jgi:putative hydrolase of the HAD superfamily
MNRFSIVSIDMFGTLVNLATVRHSVWREFLKEKYTDELADEYWFKASDYVFRCYEEKVIQQRQYISPRAMFEDSYRKLFAEIGLDYNLQKAAEVLALHHSSSELFEDTLPFLEAVGKKYTVCLSSDTDEDMLGQLRYIYPFDKVFISEKIGSYKTSRDGRFFSEVIGHYGVEPEKIIHVGDSVSDIAGAKEAGITTCWVNRRGKNWTVDITPDYEVTSLTEFATILGVDIGR